MIKQDRVVRLVFQGNQPQAGIRKLRIALQAIRVTGKANVQGKSGRRFLQSVSLQDNVRNNADSRSF
jgi:hypothetical protein